jgi:hypothetical protein
MAILRASRLETLALRQARCPAPESGGLTAQSAAQFDMFTRNLFLEKKPCDDGR